MKVKKDSETFKVYINRHARKRVNAGVESIDTIYTFLCLTSYMSSWIA